MNAALLVSTSVLLAGTPALAQAVSVTVTAATPIVARASSSSWGLGGQQSVPAGTTNNGTPGFLQPWFGNAMATSAWNAAVWPDGGEAFVTWRQRAEVYEAAPSFADASGELLVHLATTSAVPVAIELSVVTDTALATTMPTCSIDLGDDGTLEAVFGSVTTTWPGIVLGPQPFPIRLRNFVSEVGPGIAEAELRIRVQPANSLTLSPLAVGCGTAGSLVAYPTFVGAGVHFHVMTIHPVVLVLGLSAQPLLIPSPLPTPCWLLPSPDALAVMTFAQDFTLPLPPSVRPLTLWAQGVAVTPTALETLNGYLAFAF